jgi:tetratricopeptide (TPR) repeat protein
MSAAGATGSPAQWTTVPQVLTLAEQHRQAGRLAEAQNLLEQVVKAQPRLSDALHLLGVVLHQAGDRSGAIDMVKRAVAANGAVPLYYSNLAEMLRLSGRLDEAVAAGRRAVELQPGFAQALNNLGIAHYDRREFDEAVRYYRRAIAREPRFAEAYSNLGNALRIQHKLEDSIAAYHRALEIKPDFPDAVANLASVLHLIGRLDEATATYGRAIAMSPRHANAHSGLGLLQLLRGNFAQGWWEYEWRWHSSDTAAPQLPGPVWGGEGLAGRRILVYAEQGYGDALQFCRYAALLRDRGATVFLRVPPPLHTLMAESMPWVEVSSDGKGGLPAHDCHCALLSLPHRFDTRIETIPAQIPYLRATPERVGRWSARVEPGADLKVGIVWAGSTRHINDVNRSIPLPSLAPWFGLDGVQFFSLQVGDAAAAVNELPGRPVTDLSPLLTDYAETAAAIEQLDLVISVDTSVVHLAGALGKPVWTLLPWVPDWRWLESREDSPWYPTMRLFRQPERFAWGPVLERIAGELATARSDRGRLTPARRPS